MYGATIGKLAILDCEATTNQAVCACTPFEGISNRYLFIYLRAWRKRFTSMGEGGAPPNISRLKIINTPFALPPLAEQNRIVARIKDLNTRCDALESQLRIQHDSANALAASAVHHLAV